jgi:hypothetical protein
MSKVLTIVGEDNEGNLQDFHIINPMNVIVHKGTIRKPGELKDSNGEPIMVQEQRTFVRVGGQPIFAHNTVQEVLESIEDL